MGLARQIRRNMLNHFFNKSTMAQATVFYVGVSLTLPTSVGGNVQEPIDPIYARKAIVSSGWAAATDADPATITNTGTVTFAQASQDWFAGQDIPYVVLYSSLTGGTFYGFGEFARPKPIYNSDIMTVQPGKLAIALS